MQRDVIFSESNRILVAEILCDVDHHTAKPIREKIDRRLFESRPSVLVLDFSNVVFMDSSGMGLIMGRAECAAALGAEVRIMGLSPSLTKLTKLCGLDRVKNLSVIRK